MSFNAETHLKNIIIPYWNSMKDDEYGGFYGFRTYDLEILKKADKGVVLHSRILWFFSSAYMLLRDETLLDEARHAYEALLAMDEVKLTFEDGALRAIAKQALKKDTGARALRSIIESFMLDIMYEIPKDDNIGEVVITEDYVEHRGAPKILMRSGG